MCSSSAWEGRHVVRDDAHRCQAHRPAQRIGCDAGIRIRPTKPDAAAADPDPLATSFMADEEVRKVVEHGSARVRAQSVERTFALLRLQGEQARGYYFRATDRAPRLDEYKYLYQGAVLVGGTIVTFTVLYNDDAKHEADAALEVVRKMQLQTVGGI